MHPPCQPGTRTRQGPLLSIQEKEECFRNQMLSRKATHIYGVPPDGMAYALLQVYGDRSRVFPTIERVPRVRRGIIHNGQDMRTT